jgi:DNA-binding response OmpR family regulator
MMLIALTGLSSELDRDLARGAGFDHVVVKPVDLEYLRVMFDRIGAVTPPARAASPQSATHRA